MKVLEYILRVRKNGSCTRSELSKFLVFDQAMKLSNGDDTMDDEAMVNCTNANSPKVVVMKNVMKKRRRRDGVRKKLSRPSLRG